MSARQKSSSLQVESGARGASGASEQCSTFIILTETASCDEQARNIQNVRYTRILYFIMFVRPWSFFLVVVGAQHWLAWRLPCTLPVSFKPRLGLVLDDGRGRNGRILDEL